MVVYVCVITSLPVVMRSIAISVFVCLTVHLHISKTARPNFTKFSVHVVYGRIVCNAFCTSGFVDDVKFSRNKALGTESKRRHVWSSSPGGSTSPRPLCTYRERSVLFLIALFNFWQCDFLPSCIVSNNCFCLASAVDACFEFCEVRLLVANSMITRAQQVLR